jgi:hypothetical protein
MFENISWLSYEAKLVSYAIPVTHSHVHEVVSRKSCLVDWAGIINISLVSLAEPACDELSSVDDA